MKKALLVALVLAACSSNTGPVTEPSGTPPTASATAEPTAVVDVPTAAPTTEPTVDVPPVSTGRPPSGRPPLTFGKPDKVTETVGASPITTFILESEKARFRIPEWALDEGILLTFLIDKKAKKAKGGAGSVFRLQAQVPPAESFSPVSSAGPKFELKLPTAKVGSPNLAIGTAKKDDKGKDIVEWKVIAPSKVEGDFATFEITEFNDTMFQITSEPPTS